MATNNFKLFDENKTNMLTDQEYAASQQRLGGVQAGIASSMLNNKFAYQMSIVAYAIAQMMNANGYDAADSMAVSAFVGNMSNSILQKVIDKATTIQAQGGADNLKWMTPALVKSFFDYQLATQAEAQAGTDNTKWMSPLRVAQAITGIGDGLIIPVQRGGTGKGSWTVNNLLYPNSMTSLAQLEPPIVPGSVLAQRAEAPYFRSDILTVRDLMGTGNAYSGTVGAARLLTVEGISKGSPAVAGQVIQIYQAGDYGIFTVQQDALPIGALIFFIGGFNISGSGSSEAGDAKLEMRVDNGAWFLIQASLGTGYNKDINAVNFYSVSGGALFATKSNELQLKVTQTTSPSRPGSGCTIGAAVGAVFTYKDGIRYYKKVNME